MYHIPLSKAMDMFYASDTMNLMEDGIADLHCRSDKYLVEAVWEEFESCRHMPLKGRSNRTGCFLIGEKSRHRPHFSRKSWLFHQKDVSLRKSIRRR